MNRNYKLEGWGGWSFRVFRNVVQQLKGFWKQRSVKSIKKGKYKISFSEFSFISFTLLQTAIISSILIILQIVWIIYVFISATSSSSTTRRYTCKIFY